MICLFIQFAAETTQFPLVNQGNIISLYCDVYLYIWISCFIFWVIIWTLEHQTLTQKGEVLNIQKLKIKKKKSYKKQHFEQIYAAGFYFNHLVTLGSILWPAGGVATLCVGINVTHNSRLIDPIELSGFLPPKRFFGAVHGTESLHSPHHVWDEQVWGPSNVRFSPEMLQYLNSRDIVIYLFGNSYKTYCIYS